MKKKKTQRLFIRLTDEDKALIKYRADKVGLTASELVRYILCVP